MEDSGKVLANVDLGLKSFGAVTAAAGAYRRSAGARTGYNFQSSVAANNAVLEEYQAQDALTRGQAATQEVLHKGAQTKGTQRNTMAAGGVSLDYGSAVAVLAGTDYVTALRARTVGDDAAKTAWAARERAKGLQADSEMLRARANAENPGGDAFRTLLTGGGAVASSWYNYKKKGVFDSAPAADYTSNIGDMF